MKFNSSVKIFNRVSFLEKLIFTKHLSIMLKSGIPLAEAVAIVRDQSVNPTFKKILKHIKQDIDNGQQLATALARQKEVFDPLYINLIHIGEESGNLEKNLDYLALDLKKSYDFKKKVQGALLYPAIILIAAVVIGAGISFFALPKLIDLFKSLDVKLPLSTQILLFLAETMKNYGIFIILGIIIFIAAFRVVIALPLVAPHWQKFLLSLPAIGKFLQDVQLVSFCRNLGLMLKSGMPITAALRVEYDGMNNLVYKHFVGRMIKSLEKGKTISDELSALRTPFIPLIFSKMIGVGEKTGKLEDSLLYLGDFLDDEVDNYSKDLSTILEPFILIILGLIVAFVAFAVITPIYNLTGSLK